MEDKKYLDCNAAATKLVTDAGTDKEKICAAYQSFAGCQPADCCAEDSIKASIKGVEEVSKCTGLKCGAASGLQSGMLTTLVLAAVALASSF